LSPRLRDQARGSGFTEQAACSLYAEPTLERALDRLSARPVFLVPLLMSDGVTLAALRQRLEQRDDAGDVILCPVLGSHPNLPQRIAESALAKAKAAGWSPQKTALLLIGHGSRRDEASRRGLFGLGAEIRSGDAFGEVRQALLEEEPGVADALATVACRQVIAVGCFAEEGRHAVGDVPQLLAASPLPVVYDGPIGTAPWIDRLVLDLAVARRAGLSPLSAVS
jgi:sirohydrochlorin cobaltochelatase